MPKAKRSKRSKKFTLHTQEGIGGTEVFKAASRSIPDMTDIGALAGLWHYHSSKDDALYLKHKGEIAAFLLFNEDETDHTINIVLGYVLPQYRRYGLYTRLYKALVKAAKKRKLKAIYGTIVVGNEAMEAAARKLGRSPVTTTWKHLLRKDNT